MVLIHDPIHHILSSGARIKLLERHAAEGESQPLGPERPGWHRLLRFGRRLARGNDCSANRWGIYVAETADPELIDNDCRENASEDILDLRP